MYNIVKNFMRFKKNFSYKIFVNKNLRHFGGS